MGKEERPQGSDCLVLKSTSGACILWGATGFEGKQLHHSVPAAFLSTWFVQVFAGLFRPICSCFLVDQPICVNWPLPSTRILECVIALL